MMSITFALSTNDPMGDIIEAYRSWGLRNGSETTWNAPLNNIKFKLKIGVIGYYLHQIRLPMYRIEMRMAV